MRIHVENNRVKFHPDPIWNNGALAFLKRSFPQEQQEQEQQEEEDKYRYMTSAPDVINRKRE